jgi:hypothetical protein
MRCWPPFDCLGATGWLKLRIHRFQLIKRQMYGRAGSNSLANPSSIRPSRQLLRDTAAQCRASPKVIRNPSFLKLHSCGTERLLQSGPSSSGSTSNHEDEQCCGAHREEVLTDMRKLHADRE